MTHLGDRLKALRQGEKLSQLELGAKLEMAGPSISLIEKKGSASPETIEAICKFFKVKKEWLVNGEGEQPKGLVIPIRKELAENPWKDEAYQLVKAENARMAKDIEFLKELLKGVLGPKAAANFLKALNQARVNGKQVFMNLPVGPGARLGAQG